MLNFYWTVSRLSKISLIFAVQLNRCLKNFFKEINTDASELKGQCASNSIFSLMLIVDLKHIVVPQNISKSNCYESNFPRAPKAPLIPSIFMTVFVRKFRTVHRMKPKR